MSEFTKTLIVDCDIQEPEPPYFDNIKDAASALSGTGGVIIVEKGEYTIASASDTIIVYDNTTIIGRGNVIRKIEGEDANVPAFKNSSYEDSNERITISGFKIIVKYGTEVQDEMYTSNVVDFEQVNKCIIEKLYIIYTDDQNYTRGVERDTAAISIYGYKPELQHPEAESINNIISHCSVIDYGRQYDDGEGDNTTLLPIAC